MGQTKSPIQVHVQVIVQTKVGVSRNPSSKQEAPFVRYDYMKEIRSLIGPTQWPWWYQKILGGT